MAEQDDNFLSRWSRRKTQIKQGEVPSPAAAAPPVAAAAATLATVQAEAAKPLAVPALAPATPEEQRQSTPPAPSLDDVALLTKESDFSRFVAPDVDPGVKNAAMKKLFTDPHFNVMDGLDVYIDDYNTFEPIPRAMMRQLVSARMLGLLDDELEAQPLPEGVAAPAIDNELTETDPTHENADLQLQPHDAAGQRGIERGAAASADPADPARDAVPPSGA